MTRDGEAIPKFRGEALFGIHSVEQALECNHRRMHKLYLRDTYQSTSPSTKTDMKAILRIKELADKLDIELVHLR